MKPLLVDPLYCMGNRSLMEKLKIALGIIANPDMLVKDKLGIVDKPLYKMRNGVKLYTRKMTTDINDAVVVLSGKEYPEELLGIADVKNPIVLDCGGHIGTFSLFTKTVNSSSIIYTMEPVKDNLELLTKNLEVNEIEDVTIIPKALYNSSGQLYIDLQNKPFDAGQVVTTKPSHTEYVEIESITFPELLESYSLSSIDLMKIDIEGSEYPLLESYSELIQSKVKRVIMEYHPAGHKAKRDRIVELLTSSDKMELIYETKNILGFAQK